VLSRRARLLPLLTLALGAVFLLRLWSVSGILYSTHSDMVAVLAGLRALAQRSIDAGGGLPLWDPSCNAGTPAFANPVAEYAFPLEWLYRVLPLDRATNLIFTFNVLLAGLSMHLFARRRLEHPLAALFCAVAYMLSYRLLSQIDAGWMAAIPIYCLTPLLLLALECALESPDIRRTLALAAVLALCAVQGLAQGTYYALIGAAIFAALKMPRIKTADRTRVALTLASGAALAAMLSAPSLLPLFEFASLSTRTHASYAFFLNNAPRLSDLKTLLDPFDAGGARPEYWENNFYFGVTLYPLAVLACRREWKRARWLLAAGLVCIALCFDSPVLRLLFKVLPGFHLFRRTTRLLTLAQIPIVLLAAVGADVVLKAVEKRRGARSAALAAAALIGLMALDSGLRMLPRLKDVPLGVAFPKPAFLEQLRRSPENGRVAALDRTSVPYGMAGYYGIDMVNGYQPLNLRHYAEYFDVLQTGRVRSTDPAPTVWTDLRTIARPDLLRALDVRSIVANRAVPLEEIGYAPAGLRNDVPVYDFYRGIVRVPVHLWRDLRPLGPAFFASSLRPVRSEAESLAALASSAATKASALGWDAPEGAKLDFAGGTARMTQRGIDAYAYDVDSRGWNYLVLSQVWYPGWRARLDGRAARLYRTDHALLGCVVPPGRHTLRLKMTSPVLNAGLALCVAALLASAFALGFALTGESGA